MAINVSVQYNGGLLPDILLVSLCYCHRGTRLNTIKRLCLSSLYSHVLNVLTIFHPVWGMLLRRFTCVQISFKLVWGYIVPAVHFYFTWISSPLDSFMFQHGFHGGPGVGGLNRWYGKTAARSADNQSIG